MIRSGVKVQRGPSVVLSIDEVDGVRNSSNSILWILLSSR